MSNATNDSQKKSVTPLNCPICQKSIEWSEDYPDRPFCSKRCRLIDFGDWATENNRIAGNELTDDVFSEDL